MLDAFKLALSFLTIAPVKFNKNVDDTAFGKAIAYFPVVGLMLGAILSALWYFFVFEISVDRNVAGVMVVVVLAGMTRMLHLDGLADTFDGLFGGKEKEHSLTIMKDSRVGSFGVIAIACSVLSKYVLLSSLAGLSSIGTVLIFPVIGRFVAGCAMIMQPYAKREGLGALFGEGRKARELTVPTLITVVLAYAVSGVDGLLALAATCAAAAIILKWVRGKIGGLTGDIIGAVIELSEINALLTVVIIKSLWHE